MSSWEQQYEINSVYLDKQTPTYLSDYDKHDTQSAGMKTFLTASASSISPMIVIRV